MAMSIVETKTVSCLVMLAQWWSPAQWCSQDIWHSVDGTSTGKCRASHDVNLPSVTTRSPPDLPPQRTDSSLSLSRSFLRVRWFFSAFDSVLPVSVSHCRCTALDSLAVALSLCLCLSVPYHRCCPINTAAFAAAVVLAIIIIIIIIDTGRSV